MKKLNKKWLSFFGILSVLVLFIGIALPQLKTNAIDGGGVTGSGGSSGGGHLVSGGLMSNSTAGYRMYFATNALKKPSEGGDGHFDADTLNEMSVYKDVALYEFYSWDNTANLAQSTTTWGEDQGNWLSRCIWLNRDNDNSCSFSDLVGTNGSPLFDGGIPEVDYSQAVNTIGSNSFEGMISFADQIKTKKYYLKDIRDAYVKYLDSIDYWLSDNQKAERDALKAVGDCNSLMLVFEPVFVAQQADYSVAMSFPDWDYAGGNSVKNWSGAIQISTRTDKLDKVWTAFTVDGVEYNPDDSGRWKGFIIYNDINTASNSNKFSVGFNVNLQYNGEIKQNLMTDQDIKTSVSETETAPSIYTNSSSNIGDQRYTDDLTTWDKLAGDYDSNAYSISNLLMAGWTWNNISYVGNGSTIPYTPWSGISKNIQIENVKLLVPASMKDKIATSPTDYMLGVFGNMEYDAIQDIVTNELYITNNTAVTLGIADGVVADFSKPYGDANLMNSFKQDLASGMKAVTTEKAVVNANGLAFGSTFRVGFNYNNADVAHQAGEALKGILSSTGFTITDIKDLASMDADCTNLSYPKYQETPQQVQEMLSRIKGATTYAKAINYEGTQGVDSYTVKSGSEMTLSVTSMGKKTPIDSYLGSALIASEEANRAVTYKFKNVGQSYANTHLVQSPTHWEINSTTQSTISQAGEEGEHFAIVWKNSDMKSHSDYDFSYTTRSAKAKAIAEGIATYLTGHNSAGVDENSGSLISSAFSTTTGVAPLSVGYIGNGSDASSSVDLGAVFNNDGDLSGLSVLILSVGGGTQGVSEASDGLPANMLNIIAPSCLGLDSTSGSISSMTFRKKSYGDPEDWSVTHQLSGDIESMFGTDMFFYNESGVGNFGEPTVTKKWFDYGEVAYPSYAYSLTRSLWGDLPTASNFFGATADGASSNSAYKDFVTKMKFPIGNLPQYGVTCDVGANSEKQYPEFKEDKFYFEGKVIWYTGWKDGEKLWKKNTSYNRKTYYVTHKMNKYTAMDIGLATVPEDVANSLYQNNEDTGRADTFSYWSAMSDQSANVLTIYPEVNMLMQYPSGNLDVDTVTNVYVMGEKARTLQPVALRGIKVHNQGIEGQFSTDTAAVGKNASKLSRANGNLPVVYTGGNINLHIDTIGEKFDLVSYALDLRDNADNGVEIKGAFSNENPTYKPEEEHKTYVNNTLNNLEVDVTLDIDKDRDGGDNLYRYHNFNTMLSNFTIADDTTDAFNITYKHGEIDRSTDGWKAFISDLADEYEVSESEAEDIFDGSEMEGQLQRALESSEDGANNSHIDTDDMGGTHWYDEQCSVLTIKKFKTVINMGDIALSDKLDITTGNDDDSDDLKQEADRNKLFSSRAFGKWYLTMYIKNDVEFQNGEACKESQYQKLWEEKYVDGADFIVSDASTNDMRN